MKSLVIAPHADDEALGCGGTLLRRAAEGGEIGWLLVTTMGADGPWSVDQVEERRLEIERVRKELGVRSENFFELGLQPTELDRIPMRQLVGDFSDVFSSFRPEEVFVPHPYDVHSDHRVVFDAVSACSKWFRHPSVRRVLAYETVSETEFTLRTEGLFNPSVFVNISKYLDKKIEIVSIYRSEVGEHPFPRSEANLRALAQFRGAQSGYASSEAFQLLRERY